MTIDFARAAALLGRARLDRQAIGLLPDDCRPRDEAEGYAVQDALHDWQAKAGQGGLAGYKIGCTTPVMQEALGIGNPCAGGLLAANVHAERAAFRLSDYLRVGVECEIAVRLAADAPARQAPYTRDDIAGLVAACMVAIEVVEDRYADARTLGAPALIADDFFQAAAVVGEPVTAWRDIDLAGVAASTSVNGAEAGRGRGADVMGHPFEALAWLANALSARGRGLRQGDLVLTGSMVIVQWIEAPAVVSASVTGLGGVEVRFAAD